jgi:hypothetical protein
MNTRVETKWLFNEGVSPHTKSLILKSRAGIKLTDKEKNKLKKFNESVSMVSPIPLHQRQVKIPLSNTHDLEFDIELEDDEELDLEELIDEFMMEMELQEILEEMGYGK